MSDRITVLYIAGWGRSGSTTLGMILGEAPGAVFAGEVRYIWDRGLVKNRRCGCGSRFLDCSLWSEVLTQAFGSADGPDGATLAGLRDTGLRTRDLLGPRSRARHIVEARMAPYRDAVAALYRGIRDATGCRVIVDSSKYPSHAFVLSTIPDIDLRIVHLVRDPRAVAYSWWQRRKPNPDADDGRRMKSHHPLSSTLVWSEWNLIVRRHWAADPARYTLLRYEDFVAEPRAEVSRLLAFAGEPGVALPFADDGTVTLGVHHTVSGNPDRFATGSVRIRADDAWRSALGVGQYALVTALSLPWLGRYGYTMTAR